MKSVNRFTGTQAGCGHMIVYKLTENNTEYISMALNTKGLKLTNSQTYWIGKEDFLEVKWKVFNRDIQNSICNEGLDRRPRPSINLAATSGIVKIQVSDEDLIKSRRKESYIVTVELRNIVFEGLTVDYLRLENVQVG